MSKKQKVNSIKQLNERIDQLKEAISGMQKGVGGENLDSLANNKEQEMKLYSINLNLKAMKKIQDSSIEDLAAMKKKMNSFNYLGAVRINKDMGAKLKEMKKYSLCSEKNAKKIEGVFMEFEKNFLEFKEFKALARKLNNSFERYSEELSFLNGRFSEYAKEKKMLALEKKIKDLKDKINGKDHSNKNETKKRWWLS